MVKATWIGPTCLITVGCVQSNIMGESEYIRRLYYDINPTIMCILDEALTISLTSPISRQWKFHYEYHVLLTFVLTSRTKLLVVWLNQDKSASKPYHNATTSTEDKSGLLSVILQFDGFCHIHCLGFKVYGRILDQVQYNFCVYDAALSKHANQLMNSPVW